MNERLKPLVIILVLVIVAVGGFYFFIPKHEAGRPKYEREASRATVDIAQTEFYRRLKQGKSSVNDTFGGQWMPVPMPVADKYKDFLIEKLIFIKMPESINNYKQAIVMDSYSEKAFTSVSTYMKTHAKELREKNPKGKIKILHDGSKGIIYQWRIPNDDGSTKLIEIGKVCMTDDGVFSVKYINKGTSDLEQQRQRAFRFFGKVS